MIYRDSNDILSVHCTDNISLENMSKITKFLHSISCLDINKMTNGRIKEIRKIYNLTQEAFSKLIMVNYETYCSWEKGRRKPSSPGCAILHIAEKYPKIFLENNRDIVKELQKRIY